MANNEQGRVPASIGAGNQASGFMLKYEDGPSSNFLKPAGVGYQGFTVFLMDKD